MRARLATLVDALAGGKAAQFDLAGKDRQLFLVEQRKKRSGLENVRVAGHRSPRYRNHNARPGLSAGLTSGSERALIGRRAGASARILEELHGRSKPASVNVDRAAFGGQFRGLGG